MLDSSRLQLPDCPHFQGGGEVHAWNYWVKGLHHCASYGSASCESIFNLMLHNSLLVGIDSTVTLWEFWFP